MLRLNVGIFRDQLRSSRPAKTSQTLESLVQGWPTFFIKGSKSRNFGGPKY